MSEKLTKEVFAADPEGWREMNSGRPAYELVREAVQNVLDEAATTLEVEIKHRPGSGVYFHVVDDVPGGIRDEKLIWTIWLSDKQDSPTKRGRMGRGLKELISVSDDTLIVTAGGPAVQFTRSRGKWTRTAPIKKRPKTGTTVSGLVKLWGKKDADEIVEYLKRLRPPLGVDFYVNGQLVVRREAIERYTLNLPTVIFEPAGDGGRVQRERRHDAPIELFCESSPMGTPPQSWVYEMGIPIEPIDFPLSIDVGQRVPLREKRDTLTDKYRRELYAKLLDVRVELGKVTPEEMKNNHVLIATQAHEHLSVTTKEAIADAYTGGKAYATTPQLSQQATGQHIPVVPLRALPESVRAIVKEVGEDVREVMRDRAVASCSLIEPACYTDRQRQLADVWTWIARGVRRSCTVQLCTGKPSYEATFNRDMRILTVYVEVAPFTLVSSLSAHSLGLLIHELAHWEEQEDEHGMGFHADSEDVGGAVAAFLLEHADEARERAGLKAELHR